VCVFAGYCPARITGELYFNEASTPEELMERRRR
jgi:hypothetical protein